MILKKLVVLTVLATAISGCSLMGTKQLEVVSKPVQIDIMQPTLPRPVQLEAPVWYVVSEAKIANPCVKNEEGKRDCSLGKENPDWPEGYTYLDRFMDEMKELNDGNLVFVATTVGDYKVMAEDMQELKRYIKQMGEVIVYYRSVTDPNYQEPEIKTPEVDKESIRG